ncbi:hypothetical protein KXR64_13890 [Brucella intermedia]|uniref:Uncharacterized protein n=2 Tax=Brucella intermedia TaxID=94625 RepID=A0ABR6AIT8_9HYPH|nr:MULTISPECIES: hypothetical protein [Brucella/Ochrobactrum group]KAB2708922.1 hypothetical protein F9K80_13380 [Brucella intermedia]MBA8849229.1 hypothetical protein [Brucella intermedia]MCH6204645.1 hypothetical protein [Brucella ciceri]MDH0122503.1 hypothetical protein [Brucella intermedia GD04153]NVM40855.1 hypothetical protein [Brucella intermedia]
MGATGAHFFVPEPAGIWPGKRALAALPQLSHENVRASPQYSWQKQAVSFAFCSFAGVKELCPDFALISFTGLQAA